MKGMKRIALAICLLFLVFPLTAASTTSASFSLSFLASSTRSQSIEVRFTDKDLSEASYFPTYATDDSTMTFTIDAGTTRDTIQGYVTYWTNFANGGTLQVLPSKLKGTTDGNISTLDYILYLNDQSYDTTAQNDMITIPVPGTGATTSTDMKSYPLAIQSNANSFASADEDSYTGTIIIFFSAN